MNKIKVTETLHPAINYSSFDTIISELNNAKEELIKRGCSEESIEGEIDTEYSYGDSWTVYNLTGHRLETDEEYKSRIDAGAIHRARQIANLERELARLKKSND